MSYLGDLRLGDTLDFKFCTVQATGAPTTLAGSPVLSAYPNNSTTQITAGITLSVDFDSVTGLNNCRVVASNGNGYATATNYDIVITTGTVNSVSVVGYVVGSFSIENRSAVMPTTAGRTLDVSSGGEAGVDWANVGTPSSTNNLSATTIGTIGTGGIVAGSIASSAITSAKFATDAIDSNALAASAATEIAAAVFAHAFAVAYGSYTFEQVMDIILASQAAKTSGGATTTFTIRNIADSANVIVATVDADGNRSAVTITP